MLPRRWFRLACVGGRFPLLPDRPGNQPVKSDREEFETDEARWVMLTRPWKGEGGGEIAEAFPIADLDSPHERST